MARFALIQKKERWGTTWLGKLAVLLIFIVLGFVFMKTIHPFLAKNDPIETDILVVEGFITDYAIEACMEIFESGNYKTLYITGKKRMKGAHLDMYENDGEFSAATLQKLGFDSSKITVVAVEEDILKDRTYISALALHDWMVQNKQVKNFNLVTLGAHARRSRHLFQMAFEDRCEIGVISIPNQSYNPDNWWQSSSGFREINKELIAWIYARFFFRPSN